MERTVHYAIKPPAVVNFDIPGGFTIIPLPENSTQCPDTHFQCPDDGYCLPVYVRCNDVNDCPGHEDEAGCDSFTCPGFYRCSGSTKTVCVSLNHLCDGWQQCPQHDDELMCDMTCPESCICYGLAFTCTRTFRVSSFPQLRYLDASDSGLRQADVTHNIMLIHLGVSACRWSNLTNLMLPNLHSLDLSDNLLCQVRLSPFRRMHRLRRLNLAGNPIVSFLPDIKVLTQRSSIVVFNFSDVQVQSFRMNILSAVMPDLQVLDLSQSEIKSLLGHCEFQTLRFLDLRNSPVSDFAPDCLKNMPLLQLVLASNFKFCCSAILPDFFHGQCKAPSDEISSCDDLLKSAIYRFFLAVFGLFAILGNLSSFVCRLCFSSERIKTGFAIFVLHLCVSDFLMGVYLAAIGTADQVYAGVYVWKEVEWKRSAVCSTAGVLSFLSSEVSAFLICLITLDRFLVLHFPFSQVRFGPTSAHIACIVLWILGLSLATAPLFPMVSHWEFYRQTGICIPLPVTRSDFGGHSYSFSVMIVCNLILFLSIAMGQSLIYWTVRSNAMSEQKAKTKGGDSVKSKEAAIARRLLSIAVSDFLCWFPIGLCGVLAAFDVAIPGEVNVTMAIFVLPLNSALNPFLYTLGIMLEKRRKAQQLHFQKF